MVLLFHLFFYWTINLLPVHDPVCVRRCNYEFLSSIISQVFVVCFVASFYLSALLVTDCSVSVIVLLCQRVWCFYE